MIRIAAVGDIHVREVHRQEVGGWFARVHEEADVLLLAGDLTGMGNPDEMRIIAARLGQLPLPVVAVLGNHDLWADAVPENVRLLEEQGVHVLQNEALELTIHDETLGIVGTIGAEGGFPSVSTALPSEMDAVIAHHQRSAHQAASALAHHLCRLATTYKVVLLHYAPITATLLGEPPEVYPMLGSYLLCPPIDAHGADLVLHGHAHAGVEHGQTPAGIPVRNVARAVIGQPYRVYTLPLASDHEDAARRTATPPPRRVLACGYAGRTVEWLLDLLARERAVLWDIRMSPRSNEEQWCELSLSLRLGLLYRHVPAFGNVNYRGGPIALADPDAGLELFNATRGNVVLMCACRRADRCHRREVARLLGECGVVVEDLDASHPDTAPVVEQLRLF